MPTTWKGNLQVILAILLAIFTGDFTLNMLYKIGYNAWPVNIMMLLRLDFAALIIALITLHTHEIFKIKILASFMIAGICVANYILISVHSDCKFLYSLVCNTIENGAYLQISYYVIWITGFIISTRNKHELGIRYGINDEEKIIKQLHLQKES
jgi:hypothetical protein